MIRSLGFIFLITLLVKLSLALTTPAFAQTRDSCLLYYNAVRGGSSGSVPIVPDALLTEWKRALPCLIEVIGSLQSSVRSPNLEPDVRSKFLSATGAIRAIITKLNAEDEKAGNRARLNEFIKEFRAYDTLEVISILTYGARSDSYDMRLNSVLILGNVIDNSTVCVLLAHLNDPNLEKTDYGKMGRANLLGVVSVVAPWAYKENFDSISQTRNSIWEKIDKNDPNLIPTREVLVNIKSRLDAQTSTSNKSITLPSDENEVCKSYIQNHFPSLSSIDSLKVFSPQSVVGTVSVQQRHVTFLRGEFQGKLAVYVGDISNEEPFHLIIFETGLETPVIDDKTRLKPNELKEKLAQEQIPYEILYDAEVEFFRPEVDFTYNNKPYTIKGRADVHAFTDFFKFEVWPKSQK